MAALLAAGAVAISAGPAAAATGNGCDPYLDGTLVPVPCSSGSGTAGSGALTGTGASATGNQSCTFVPLSPGQAQSLGLSAAPPGQAWALLDCVGGEPGAGPQAALVSTATGTPQVTPEDLMLQALGELRVPALQPATAPPRGGDALVGLPEWFWIPAADWHPRSITVAAGAVWATVTATPSSLSFAPGGGLSPVSCPGPGTPYNPGEPAAGQHSACSFTYAQPSAGLPGNAYQASVAVTWQVSWTGSGGAGGILAAALSVPVGLTIPVAQGEALVTSP